MSSYFVDPSINANSGTGTIGDPYGDLQYALDSITRDTTNGDVINVKTGTAEVLAATLDFSTYGTPTFAAGLVIAGYTATEEDGGQAEIDCNGGAFINQSTFEGVLLRDLNIHNGGSSTLVDLDRFSSVCRCKLSNTSGTAVNFTSGDGPVVSECWFTDVAQAIDGGTGIIVADCLFQDGSTRNFGQHVIENPRSVTRCCFYLQGTNQRAIRTDTSSAVIANNSCFFTSGSSGGRFLYTRAIRVGGVVRNLVDGPDYFGQITTAGEALCGCVADNSYANLGTGIWSNSPDTAGRQSGFDDLGTTSPFAKTGSITSFADRLTYFAPVDVGSVSDGPGGLWRGAVQPTASGGSGGVDPLRGGLIV